MSTNRVWFTLVPREPRDPESVEAAALFAGAALATLDHAVRVADAVNAAATRGRPDGHPRVRVVAHVEVPSLMDHPSAGAPLASAADAVVGFLTEEPSVDDPARDYGVHYAGGPPLPDGAPPSSVAEHAAWLGRRWPDGSTRNLDQAEEGVWHWKMHALVRALADVADPLVRAADPDAPGLLGAVLI